MYPDIDPYTRQPVLAPPVDIDPQRRPPPQHRRRLLPDDDVTVVGVLLIALLAAVPVVALLLGLLADRWALWRGPGVVCTLFLIIAITVHLLVRRRRR